MNDKKILFITDQIFPFVDESEMSNVCRNLPQAMQELGHEIRTFMPKWGPINERRNQLHEVIRLSGMNMIIDDTDHPLIIKVASLQSARMQVYFIDNEDYFQNRLFTCDDEGKEYDDNDERTIFFGRGVLETVKKLRWNPDIIHCHGWLSALVPLYVKTAYKDEPAFRDSKVVFSVYEDNFSSCFNENYPEILLTKDMTISDIGEITTPIDYCALLKKSIDFSDGIIQNSQNVNEELIKHVKSKNKKFLSIQESSDCPKSVNEFYKSLFS